MASEIEIETEKSQQTQEKDTGSNHVVPVVLTLYDTDRKTVKEVGTVQSGYKFQRTRKYNEFSQAYYYLFGNKGAGTLTRGYRL